MNILKIIKSREFLAVIILLFGCSVLIGAFGVGELVGYRKARFSYEWSEQYDRNFGGPRRGIFGIPGEAVFQNPFGVDGTVMQANDAMLVVSGRDLREKIIRFNAQTQVRSFRTASDGQRLIVGDHIVVIGEPNDQGQIFAKFIRILP